MTAYVILRIQLILLDRLPVDSLFPGDVDYKGMVTYEAVARDLNYTYYPAREVL